MIIKKPLSRRDLEIVMKTIKKAEADIIFTPGEIADPHGIHGMCIRAIETALKNLELKLKDGYIRVDGRNIRFMRQMQLYRSIESL